MVGPRNQINLTLKDHHQGHSGATFLEIMILGALIKFYSSFQMPGGWDLQCYKKNYKQVYRLHYTIIKHYVFQIKKQIHFSFHAFFRIFSFRNMYFNKLRTMVQKKNFQKSLFLSFQSLCTNYGLLFLCMCTTLWLTITHRTFNTF